MKAILFATALLSSSMAATLTLKGPLTEKSAYHLHEAFVQSSGAYLGNAPYQGYNMTLGDIRDVDAKDVAELTKVINNWLQENVNAIRGMKFNVGKAETDSKHVIIKGEYMTSDFYLLRDGLRQAIESAKVPSGREYTLWSNCHGIFVPSIYVGDIKGFTPKQVIHRINRRIQQSQIIHKDPYFEIEVGNLKLYQN